jgi:16S rRNA (guanine966-N2)-methyltransferase
MRVQIRIVAGELRGRKLTCDISPELRPTPQMVREALFSILGNAVPDRPFYDVFAGTGVVGLEALSRGASSAEFIERDFRLGQDIERHLKAFDYADVSRVRRSDVYRWAENWKPPDEPVNVFLSPPFPDLEQRPEELLRVLRILQLKLAPGSVLILQAEESELLDKLPDPDAWDRRRYGRNHLLFWGGATEDKEGG